MSFLSSGCQAVMCHLRNRAGGKPGKSALAAKAAEMDALARRAVRTVPSRRPLPGGGAGGAAPPAKWRRLVPPEQREQVRLNHRMLVS